MHSYQHSNKAVRGSRPASAISNARHKEWSAAIQLARCHPQSMSPSQMMLLQRTIGNRAVIQLFRQYSAADKATEQSAVNPETPRAAAGTIQASPSAGRHPVQRKVYIKRSLIGRLFHDNKYRNKTESSRGDVGTGDRNVKTMMEDDKSRYFDSKSEMIKYARKETERIGYVEKTKTWIRIPNKLTVIGENHTQTTLADVVKAVGTDKYMYEAFTERPAEAAGNEELANAMKQREDVIGAKFDGVGIGPGKKSHYAESFYPKLIRGITGISCSHSDGDIQIHGSEPEKKLFGMTIRFAASADPSSGLYQAYSAQKELWQRTAASLEGEGASFAPLIEAMKSACSTDLFTNFVKEAIAYATMKTQEEQDRASAKDKKSFAEKWHVAQRDYDKEDSPIMKAEKARDFSMFQHIKKAKSQGYLLYGLGNLHLIRLKELLDAEGINAVNMDKFMNQQKSIHPQT